MDNCNSTCEGAGLVSVHVAALFLTLATACSSEPDVTNIHSAPGVEGLEPTPEAAPVARAARTLRPVILEYASTTRVELANLEVPQAVRADQISASGAARVEWSLVAEALRFVALSDPGTDGLLELTVALADEDVVLPIEVRSARPTEIVAHREASEDGSVVNVPALEIVGLGPAHELVARALSFGVADFPPLDPEVSSATLFAPLSGQLVDLRPYWQLDESTNRLVLDDQAMATLVAELPAADLVLDVGLASTEATAFNWSLTVHNPSATLLGRTTSLDGNATSELAGQRLALYGIDNQTRQVVTVEDDGSFVADGLVEGTYDVLLLDEAEPDFWRTTVAVLPGASTVEADFAYRPTPTVEKGLVPPATEGLLSSAVPAACLQPETSGTLVFSVTSGQQDVTQRCVGTATVAKGTRQIGVFVSATSQEYPTYTSQREKNVYNDMWSYAIDLRALGTDRGTVNKSHYSQGSTSKSACIDVSAQAANTDLQINVNLTSTNVGDGAVPTQVVARIAPSCETALELKSARFEVGRERALIRPLNSAGNAVADYLSLPIRAPERGWGIPLAVEFAPLRAQITAVRVGIIVGGRTLMSEDVSHQISNTRPGWVYFESLVIPQFPIERFQGRVSAVVQLTGTIDGESYDSDAARGTIRFGADETTFIPLFAAGDELATARRFGMHEERGGDAWARHETIEWLLARPYRFNDVSALHVSQCTGVLADSPYGVCKNAKQGLRGFSELGHKGHSDGAQIDLLYADGRNGFEARLGGGCNGEWIREMLEDAAREVAGGNAAGPALALAQSWIRANRQMLEREATGVRKIFVGTRWIHSALFNGRFPLDSAPEFPTGIPDARLCTVGTTSNGTCGRTCAPSSRPLLPGGAAIPNVGAWTAKPGPVAPDPAHMDHWHISL